MAFHAVDDQGRPVRGKQRGQVRADEEMFLIPDRSQVSYCQALIAADIDGIERSSVQYMNEGLLVPHCVIEVHNDLQDYPPPCCDPSSFPYVSFMVPLPRYVGDYLVGDYLIGSGFTTETEIYVDGEPTTYGDDYAMTSPNVIDGPWLGGSLTLGQTVEIVVIGGGRSFTYVTPPAIEPPPDPTMTGVTPLTGVAGTPTRVTITGTNFLPGDKVRMRYSPYSYVYYSTSPVSLTPTEMVADVRMLQDPNLPPPTYPFTAKIGVTRPNPFRATSEQDFVWTAPA